MRSGCSAWRTVFCMRDELKYDNDEEKWYEKVEGEWVETEMPEVLVGIKGD